MGLGVPKAHLVLWLRPSEDKYRRSANQQAGAYSVLTGIAANRSMVTKRSVTIDVPVHDIGLPDFPPMPLLNGPLSFDYTELLSVVL